MRQYPYLTKNQPEVKVATPAYHTGELTKIWFVTLAAALAGFFYFFGGNLWHALSGG